MIKKVHIIMEQLFPTTIWILIFSHLEFQELAVWSKLDSFIKSILLNKNSRMMIPIILNGLFSNPPLNFKYNNAYQIFNFLAFDIYNNKYLLTLDKYSRSTITNGLMQLLVLSLFTMLIFCSHKKAVTLLENYNSNTY